MKRIARAAVLRADGTTPLEDVELPPLEAGDVRARLLACGVCTGEAMKWYVAGKSSAILGHEIVAEVVEVAPGGSHDLRPGDRIFPHHHAPCGGCEACEAGLESSCEKWKKSRLVPGGYSTEFVVPRWNAERDTVRIPASLGDEAATMIEPFACVIRAVEKAERGGRGEPRRIAIVGLGFMAQLCAILLRARHPAAKIVGTDFLPVRREQGRGLGLDDSLDPAVPGWEKTLKDRLGGEPRLVVVCPSSAKAVAQGLSLVAPGGRVVLFAPPAPNDPVSVDFNRHYFRETEIVSAYSAGPEDVRASVRFLETRASLFSSLVSHVRGLEEVGATLAQIGEQDPGIRKVVVKPHVQGAKV